MLAGQEAIIEYLKYSGFPGLALAGYNVYFISLKIQ